MGTTYKNDYGGSLSNHDYLLFSFTLTFLYQLEPQDAAMGDQSQDLSDDDDSRTLVEEGQGTNTPITEFTIIGQWDSPTSATLNRSNVAQYKIQTTTTTAAYGLFPRKKTILVKTTIQKRSTGALPHQLLSPLTTTYLALGHSPSDTPGESESYTTLAEIDWTGSGRGEITYNGYEVSVEKNLQTMDNNAL